MTTDRMTAKLAKLKALAERGEGGERETALRLYKELREKYGIAEEAIEAAAAEPTTEEAAQEFSNIQFTLWVLANNLAEEAQVCARCRTQQEINCDDCATAQNRADLERQYEELKAKFERGAAV